MSDEIHKMEYPEDPHRCQGKGKDGQCVNQGFIKSVDDEGNPDYAIHCAVHGGKAEAKKDAAASTRLYRLSKWQNQLERHATAPNIKNLRDEIGILRILMEEKLNSLQDTHDLILHSGAVSDLVLKIEKLVSSCHKLEGSMGQLLDKQAILQFASEIITIISSEITDTSVLTRITDRIMQTLGRGGEQKEQEELKDE